MNENLDIHEKMLMKDFPYIDVYETECRSASLAFHYTEFKYLGVRKSIASSVV